jgi:hypothetical protein
LLSSFEWDVTPMFLVPGAYASGKPYTSAKWETWVACDGQDPIQVRNMSSLWWTPPPWSKKESLGQ